MKRVEFAKEQKREMLRRAMRDNLVFCEGCGLNVTGKRFEFDHTIPEALVRPVHPDRKLTAEDGKLLGYDCCHRGPDGKTARDIEAIAQAKRREDAHFGIRAKIHSRGFRKAPPRRTASRPLARMES